MSSSPLPSVALLYGDVELNRHVRDALLELGVRIAHEGLVADASSADLLASDATTVVVNLESVDEDHLDHLYDVLEAGDWDVVFNDAEASHALSGWDRARWARHLAAKLTGCTADADPPRPPDGDAGEPAAANVSLHVGDADDATIGASHGHDEDAGFAIDDGLGVELTVLSDTGYASDAAPGADAVPADAAALDAMPGLSDPHAGLPGYADNNHTATPAWSLIELDVADDATQESDSTTPSAIGAMDALHSGAADLAPGASGLEMGLMPAALPEDADDDVAMFHEMRMDAIGRNIGRVVVIVGDGATMPGIGQLLAALPRPVPGLVLMVQHPEGQGMEVSAADLAGMAGLPVKVVATEAVAREGEVWLVPPKGSLRVLRDGHMALLDDSHDTGTPQSQLDRCVEALTAVFADQVTLVVMCGKGSDGLVGARLVAACGGQVWLEEQALAATDSLAQAIGTEDFATGSGSPAQLAGYLARGTHEQ